VNEIYAKHTKQSIETLMRRMDRDHFMSAEEAKDLGLVDQIVRHRSDFGLTTEKSSTEK
jgi:ATP-dependent Clp protease protease subunit